MEKNVWVKIDAVTEMYVLKNENIPGLIKCTLAIDLKIND